MKKGFCEKAWQTDRDYKGKPIYKALITNEEDGEREYDFFTQKEILDYQGKEVSFTAEKGDWGWKGRLPEDKSKSGKGKSPEERGSIERQTHIKEANKFTIALMAEGFIPKDPLVCRQWLKDNYEFIKAL